MTETLLSAIRTFVLPRSAPDFITRVAFVSLLAVFRWRLQQIKDFAAKDNVRAFYAPLGLLCLPPLWLTLVCLGYAGMYWAIGVPLSEVLRVSGSSLLTLGIASVDGAFGAFLMFSEATVGLILIALLISYLPTIYAAFSRRESAVTMLEVRAGTPPSAIEMIKRYHRVHGLDRFQELWSLWEIWFAELAESHTSLPVLGFFRSPRPDLSWITASGAILDGAALVLSTVNVPFEAKAALCIRAGFLALRHICDYFDLHYNPDPHYPADSISITRAEYDVACEQLAAQGVPLKPDREQAWIDFAGWRVNYDTPLLALCSMLQPPIAPWSSDRAPALRPPALKRAHRH